MNTQSELDIIESGRVTAPAAVGTNALNDFNKSWAANVHKNRLVRIVSGAGAGQLFPIEGNDAKTLIIRGSWLEALDTASQYVILGIDIAQIIRETLGGSVSVDLPAEFDELKAALSKGLEASVDTGIATDGSNNTLEDTGKNWAVNMWGDVSIIEVVIDGVHYLRRTVSNTATIITFNALPGGVAVATGCEYSIKRQLNPLNPLEQAVVHNQAVVAATDILGAALAPTSTPCLFRIAVSFDTAGIFSVTITRGGNTQVQQFNTGVNLVANCLYMFDHYVHAGDTINYRYSVNATCQTMRVQEIVGGVQ